MEISIDFVTGLPDSNGYNAILVVVDRLTKMRNLIPTIKECDAAALADLFIDYVWKLHGLPETIVSERGTQFTLDFWKSLCSLLEISPRYSTAFHPQTDGQMERINAVIEQYLRVYLSYQQDDWSRFLPLAEFASNNNVSETTHLSPFEANYGRHPRMTFGPLIHGKTTAEDRANRLARDMSHTFEFLCDEMKRSQMIQEDSPRSCPRPQVVRRR
jgi:transposase InsO family protein